MHFGYTGSRVPLNKVPVWENRRCTEWCYVLWWQVPGVVVHLYIHTWYMYHTRGLRAERAERRVSFSSIHMM